MSRENEALRSRIDVLEVLVEEVRRGGKRQAAPFRKGEPKAEPKKPGRRSGENHGRHGHRMAAVTPDRELVAPLPECCPHCGGQVEHERWAERDETELPEARPVVTRFRVGVGRCRSCRRRVQGRHPEQTSDALGAAGASLGPRAKALGHFLHYVLGLSFAKSARLLGTLGVPVTAGALCSGAQSTSLALVPTHQAIRASVAGSEAVVMDETGWRVGGHGAWLWAATTDQATVYDVAEGRGFTEACRLVPDDYDAVIVRDGWAPYRGYTAATHQSCLAHLLRRCHELIDLDPARWAPRQVKRLLLDALAARDLPDRQRAEAAADLARRLEEFLAVRHAHPADQRLAKHLANERDALFSFLTHPGVDATNWRAEQAIRPAVVNRKVWGGNRTWRGARTQGRMMSFFRTAAQQGADSIQLLVGLARAPDRQVAPGLHLTLT